MIVIDDMCHIANLGDSRALLSEGYGKRFYQITKDHKPDEDNEKKRILENGGRIYQGVLNLNNNSGELNHDLENTVDYSLFPWRIFPGKLSVIILNN